MTCLLAGSGRTAAAQAGSPDNAPPPLAASRILATHHWTYEYIRRLRERGYLGNLNPLAQPYRRLDIASGLAALDTNTLREPAIRWVRLLRDEFWPELEQLAGADAMRFGGRASGGVRASTSKRLDALRPTGAEDAWPWHRVGVWFATGPVVGELQLYGDTYFNDDPDGLDPGQRRGGRPDLTYVSVDVAIARVVLGRFERNWSPLGSTGLMVSDRATAYPQLGFELRAGRFTLTSFTGELEPILDQQRYLAAHRLDYANGDLHLAVGEALLYASPRGGFQLRYVNPLEFLFFDTEASDVSANLMLDIQGWYRVGSLVFVWEGVLDDIAVNPPGNDPAPTRYAVMVGARWVPAHAPVSLSAEYKQVSSFAYRTNRIVDGYTFLQRGLGENFSDFDRLTLAAVIDPPVGGLTLSPTLQVQRQGEGSPRVPFPPNDVFLASPALFLGVRETTYRLGLRGSYQPSRFFWIRWDLGQNFVRDANHISGNNRSEFSATGEIGVVVEAPLGRDR